MSAELIPSPAPRVFQGVAVLAPAKGREGVLEFLTTQINNDQTRKAYMNATRHFAEWCDARSIGQIACVQPGDSVGELKTLQMADGSLSRTDFIGHKQA